MVVPVAVSNKVSQDLRLEDPTNVARSCRRQDRPIARLDAISRARFRSRSPNDAAPLLDSVWTVRRFRGFLPMKKAIAGPWRSATWRVRHRVGSLSS